MKILTSDTKFLLLVLPLVSILLFSNLGNITLWQDEAETALLAQNILEYGYPAAWDGKNIITQNAGREYNEHFVWTWSPWLQFYVTAGAFFLFGATAFSARLAFVLVGIASLPLLYVYCRKLTGSKIHARLSVILMGTSIPFLLHARQCRWYMLAVFSAIWLLQAYGKLEDDEDGGVLHFVIASVMLFHSNYIIYLSFVFGILIYYGLSAVCNYPRPKGKKLFAGLGATFLLVLPWVLYTKAWDKSNTFETYKFSLMERVQSIAIKTIHYVNWSIFPVILFIGVALIYRRSQPRAQRNILLLSSVMLATIALYSLLPWMYFRYLIALVPVGCILLAIVIAHLLDSNRLLGTAVLLALIFTNVFTLPLPPHQIRFDLVEYLYEITHDYDGPNEGIVNYLNSHGNPKQLVLTNYGQLPIIFYTGMRAVGFGQDPRLQEKADWIIPRQGRGNYNYLRSLTGGYELVPIPYPDIPWENIPDPLNHKYRTVTEVPRVTMYRNRDSSKNAKGE